MKSSDVELVIELIIWGIEFYLINICFTDDELKTPPGNISDRNGRDRLDVMKWSHETRRERKSEKIDFLYFTPSMMIGHFLVFIFRFLFSLLVSHFLICFFSFQSTTENERQDEDEKNTFSLYQRKWQINFSHCSLLRST